MSSRHVDPLAARYAQVLGEVAEARGGEALLGEVGDALSALGRAWAEDREFRAFFLSGMVKEDARVVAFRTLLAALPDLLQDFVHLCVRRQRGREIDKIAIAYEAYMDERLGRVPVTLTTATPVPEDRVQTWMDRIHAALGKQPVLHHVVDPELIAGATMRVGNVVVDGSARHRLAVMRQHLRERGKHALQG